MRTRRAVVVGAICALAVVAVAVILSARVLLRTNIEKRHIAATNELAAPDDPERVASNGGALSRAAPEARIDASPAQESLPGMDPHRTAEIRRALAAISDAGVARLWAPPTTPAPVASDTTFMPEPDMSHGNQADAGLGRYITKRIHEDFYPLAEQCYDAALARSPNWHGKMTLKMRIVGDHRVGAVIDSTEIDDSSESVDPEFRTCLKESAMTINFAPPPDGTHEITSVFSMDFAPGPPEGK